MDGPERQSKAFGWIADGAKVLDDLEEQVADTGRTLRERADDELRVEGAQLVLTALRNAIAEAFPNA